MTTATRKRPDHSHRGRKWSQHVTETSDAMTLEHGVFTGTPSQIARSLKRSAERSRRRKSDPFPSAMSMLNFYINRAGAKLSASRRKRLEGAKDALRRLFHKTESPRAAHSH